MCKQVCECTSKAKVNIHKHDACIRAWLDGKPVEVRMANGDWKLVVQTHLPSFDTGWEYRIKPEPATDLEQYGIEVGDLWAPKNCYPREKYAFTVGTLREGRPFSPYGSPLTFGSDSVLMFRRGVINRLSKV